LLTLSAPLEIRFPLWYVLLSVFASMKTSLTQEGLFYLFIVIGILIGSLIREVNTMLLFASFMAAPTIIAFRLGRRTIRGINVRRNIPAQIFAGESFIVGIEAINSRPVKRFSLSCWGLVVIDRIRRFRENDSAPKEKPYEPAVYFNHVPNGQSRQQTYAGCLPQRGRYQFEQVQITTRFPFGFFWNKFDQLPSQKTSEFFVYPKIGKLSSRWKSQRRKANESMQRLRYQPSRQIGDFLGIRPWQHGDTKKEIHRRASAKHQSPVVRQYELHQNQDCTIILDLYHEGDWNDSHRESFELAVSFAATLVSDLARRGEGHLFFASNKDPEESIYAPQGIPVQDQVLRQLTVAAHSKEDHLAETLLKIPAHHQSEIIFVTINSVDIDTSPRFKEFCEDSRYRGLLRRLQVVNTSSEELAEFFSV
jgi:uncharacterized protein (DUF58 family)